MTIPAMIALLLLSQAAGSAWAASRGPAEATAAARAAEPSSTAQDLELPASPGELTTTTEVPAAPAATLPVTRTSSPAPASAMPPESPWRIGIAAGYGVRSNPLIHASDVPIAIDLDIAWFGKRFFFDNGDLGVTVADNDAFTLNLVGRFNSDRVFFGRTDTKFVRVGVGANAQVTFAEPVPLSVPERRYAVEAGFELLMDGDWGLLQLTAHGDVGNTHGGYELFVDYGYGWRNRRWYIEPSLGLTLKSAALNDYYWGVRSDEASGPLPVYRAGSGVNSHARLLLTYQLTRRWTFAAVAEYERLNGSAASSPIVADPNVLGYFAGFGYRF